MAILESRASRDGDEQTIAQQAYVYLYPLILMDVTRRQLLNLDPKISPLGGTANAFTHIRSFPTADMRFVVRPNFDTLYSTAWLDLTRSSQDRQEERVPGDPFADCAPRCRQGLCPCDR